MPTNTMNNKTTQKQQVEQRPLEERQELEKYYNEQADNENQKTDRESSTNPAQHNREATVNKHSKIPRGEGVYRDLPHRSEHILRDRNANFSDFIIAY